MALSQLPLVDIYLGHDYAEYTTVAGGSRLAVPPACTDDLHTLRQLCAASYGNDEVPEFAVSHGGIRYRVTGTLDVTGHPFFVLSHSSATTRKTVSLGYPSAVREYLLSKGARGLVLVSGPPGSGKTSAVSSFVVERCTLHGEQAWAIEDPPEIMIHGSHGAGRVTQIPASRLRGGYAEQLKRALRARVNTIMLGEIRDEDTAAEAVLAGINGHLILGTLHASTNVHALRRIVDLTSARLANPAGSLSDALAVLIHQKLVRDEQTGVVRTVASALSLRHTDQESIRSKLREGRIEQINQDVEDQAKRTTWQ